MNFESADILPMVGTAFIYFVIFLIARDVHKSDTDDETN